MFVLTSHGGEAVMVLNGFEVVAKSEQRAVVDVEYDGGRFYGTLSGTSVMTECAHVKDEDDSMSEDIQALYHDGYNKLRSQTNSSLEFYEVEIAFQLLAVPRLTLYLESQSRNRLSTSQGNSSGLPQLAPYQVVLNYVDVETDNLDVQDRAYINTYVSMQLTEVIWKPLFTCLINLRWMFRRRLGEGGSRFWNSIGLGFKTPREAIEVFGLSGSSETAEYEEGDEKLLIQLPWEYGIKLYDQVASYLDIMGKVGINYHVRMLLFKKDKRHMWQGPLSISHLSTSHCPRCTSAILISYGTDVEFVHRQVQEHAQTYDVNVYNGEKVNWLIKIDLNRFLVVEVTNMLASLVQDEVVEDLDLEDFESASDSEDMKSNREKSLKEVNKKTHACRWEDLH
ncbi:hypothetical protein Tco_1301263 [Tanacetum coccineum]